MKNQLTDTPLHRKIQRAFPQTDFPERSIALLSTFEEGKKIEASHLSKEEMLVCFDLATAGLIECTRKPVYHNEQFAGFENSFRYQSDLDYRDIAPKEVKSEKGWIFWLVWVLFGATFGAWASSAYLLKLLQSAH